MLPFKPFQKSLSKIYVCNSSLPFYINPEQSPTKKKPFDTVNDQAFSHTVEILISVELCDKIWPHVEPKIAQLEYSRVMMSPSELLEGDFFNQYIKRGNILMLSEGRPGIDNKYILKDGHIHLELPKDIYERTGLQGRPTRSKGRKHVKTRYTIEIDLRAPSMLHGKKGFERIVWAFKNVLNHSVTWLFYDFEKQTDSERPAPIAKHHPFHHKVTPKQATRSEILTPPLHIISAAESEQDFEDWALDTYEWLGLVSLASPRVQASDNIDPFLSRYRVPGHEDSSDEPRRQSTIVALTWKGFIPSLWIRDLVININNMYHKHVVESEIAEPFLTLSAYAFRTQTLDQRDGYTMLCLPGSNTSDWAADEVPREEGQEKAKPTKDRRGIDFVLWEIVNE